ncbi:MAG: valine--tRNA ligase [Actinomycetota bacterium]
MDARAELEGRTRYEAAEVEGRIFAGWQADGLFDARPDAPGDPFCIQLPPPNVTGSLHMGHALNGAVQDLLIRWRRMEGRNVLWQPGTDHAGIATQMVVERELAKEGLTRHDLGREAFVERVWAWKDQTGSTIIEQYKRLGASMDYGRERFTMDEAYARAVQDVFVALHAKGWIYRDEYLVNWSVPLATAISDLEVEHKDVDDVLDEVAYPVEGGGEIVIATVRPVTILADVAIAVHPEDPRYADLIGRSAIVPLVDRPVPIIADERVEIGFGTGALKITPGHDPTDFEIGRDHGLETLSAIGLDGRLTDLVPEWEGLDADAGHARAVERLRETGALRAEHPYRHSVGFCSRSGARIEPLISLQWFCRMDELAAPAIDAVKSGAVRFHPERMAKIYLDWMEAIRPWCVSRQLWWGHRLPVWFAPDGSYTVQVDRPEGDGWEQSTDVLDTWFSSALWPYATLGWPERTPSLERWYPGDVLVTGRDIINLWVARMIMTGIEFAGGIPFTDVYINSTIQAADGRRMSKSLGTGVDPLDLIDRYGADATRYGLLKMCSTQDVRFAEGMIDEGRGLANKLFNATRLVLLNADPAARPEANGLEAADRWILDRLAATIAEVTADFAAYRFSPATKTLYAFVWNEFCDWYLEAIKARLYGDDAASKRAASETALLVVERTLALLHPVLPFVTEELWSLLPDRAGLLARAPFPTADGIPRDPAAAATVGAVVEAVQGARRLRQDADLGPRAELVAVLQGEGADALRAEAALLEALGAVRLVETADAGPAVPLRAGTATLRIQGADLADKLRSRLERRLAEARAEERKAAGKLGNAKFVERAPAEVVAEERERVERFGRDAAELEAQLAALGGD